MGRQATDEGPNGVDGMVAQVVHCIEMSKAGLVSICDRQGNRVRCPTTTGRSCATSRSRTSPLPDKRGTAWWVAFSPDAEQKHLYVMNGGTEQAHPRPRERQYPVVLGRPGHQIGNFTHGHTVAVDAQGSITTAEKDWGRRIQKFKIVRGQ